jgi:dTDP-D-glucose 4,6-dehydratase
MYDVVQTVLVSVKNSAVEDQVFNVGSGKPTSIGELAKTVLELAGVDLMIRYEKPRVGDIKDSYADISKAKKLLGYEPKISLRDGLRGLLKENCGLSMVWWGKFNRYVYSTYNAFRNPYVYLQERHIVSDLKWKSTWIG